ncbi:MAG TPA: cob(I)yrinic acid a,c-diamide adenosyltransferase [Candidatus Limnocylindrales bacterium]
MGSARRRPRLVARAISPSRRPALAKSAVATGKGDDGTTGLLYGGRVSKADPRTEAYGAVDEAVAALGTARIELTDHGLTDLSNLVLRLQRELFVVGAELATGAIHADRLTDGVSRVSESMLDAVEAELARWESAVTMPREFVIPGETRASAALEVARSVIRRAERRIVALAVVEPVAPVLQAYINRVADLIWVLARAAEQAEHVAPTKLRG